MSEQNPEQQQQQQQPQPKPFSTKPNRNFKVKVKSTGTFPVIVSKPSIQRNPYFKRIRQNRPQVSSSSRQTESLSSSSLSSFASQNNNNNNSNNNNNNNASSSFSSKNSINSHQLTTVGGKPRIRKFHSKSKNGCLSCKETHIKCDEAKPVCKNCQSKLRNCIYPDPTVKTKSKQKSKSISLSPESLTSTPTPPGDDTSVITSPAEDVPEQNRRAQNVTANQSFTKQGQEEHYSSSNHHYPPPPPPTVQIQQQQQQQPSSSVLSSYAHLDVSNQNRIQGISLDDHQEAQLQNQFNFESLKNISANEANSQLPTPIISVADNTPICTQQNIFSNHHQQQQPLNTQVDPNTSFYNDTQIPLLDKQQTHSYTEALYQTPPDEYEEEPYTYERQSSVNAPVYLPERPATMVQQQVVVEEEEEIYRDDQQQQQQQQRYSQVSPIYMSPRNSPKLQNQAGLPYDYIVAFFQNYLADLLSQNDPNARYVWKTTIPQLAHYDSLLSNSLIAYTCFKLKSRVAYNESSGKRPLLEMKKSILDIMYTTPYINFPTTNRQTLEEDVVKSNMFKNQNRKYNEEYLPERAKAVLDQIVQTTGSPPSNNDDADNLKDENSTYSKLDKLATFSYGCALRQLASSINYITVNAAEKYFASILIYSYCLNAGIPIVSNWAQSPEEAEEQQVSTPPEFDSSDESDSYTKNYMDSPELANVDALPDSFKIFKSTTHYIRETHDLVGKIHPSLAFYSIKYTIDYSLDNFIALDIFHEPIFKLFVPYFKQIVHMSRGYPGLCDEIVGARNLDLEDDSEETKQKDLEVIVSMLMRVLPVTKITEYQSAGNSPTPSGSATEQSLSEVLDSPSHLAAAFDRSETKIYQFKRDDKLFPNAPFEASVLSHITDLEDPFAILPGELELCCMMLFIVTQSFMFAEKNRNILYFWAVFRDMPEEFLILARNNRPFPLLLLVMMAAVLECTQWFLDFTLLRGANLITKRLRPEWMPATYRSIELFEGKVNHCINDDPWMKSLLRFRKDHSSQRH